MKKTAIISAILLIIVLSWGHIHAFLVTQPDFAAMHEEDVVLYGTSWCSNCAQTRKFLQSRGIPYFEYDVENSSEGYRQYKQLQGNGYPLVLVKREVVRGYDPVAIINSLRRQE